MAGPHDASRPLPALGGQGVQPCQEPWGQAEEGKLAGREDVLDRVKTVLSSL